MRYAVVDIEADSLLKDVTKIHCLSYQFVEEKSGLPRGEVKTLTKYEDIKFFVTQPDLTIVGHHFIGYDAPVLKKILNIEFNTPIIDTLPLSWYLFNRRIKHGLEAWGVDLGIEKVVIEDWENQSLDDYIKRCEEDVKINARLYLGFCNYLNELYPKGYNHVIKFLNFKMECLHYYEMNGFTFDKRLAEESSYKIEYLIEEKQTELKKNLPKVLLKERPKKILKKDGTKSAAGVKWEEKLVELGLPLSSTAIYEDGNPGSFAQIKSWLVKLGWKPKTFKVGTNGNKIPQLSLPFGAGICPSVKDLYKKEPSLKLIEGLFVLKHRLGLFKSFLKHEIDGKLHMGASSTTSTSRWQHRAPLVNLPGVNKEWGAEIRGCLTRPDENHLLFGADISGLEDNTKYHFMYYYDPEYVETMKKPDFDGHLDIAVFAGLLKEEEVEFFKEFSNLRDEEKEIAPQERKNEYKRISKIRASAKTINFGGLYGIGPNKLAENLKISLEEATLLHKAYWKRNHAVKLIEKDVVCKEVMGQAWIYNPVSNMWVFLKNEKDIFSTLNQNTGSYVFSLWLKYSKMYLEPLGVVIPFEYHDEVAGFCKSNMKEVVKYNLQKAMDKTNEMLKLNVTIKFSVEFGNTYSDIH